MGTETETGSIFSAPSLELVEHATRELGYTERMAVQKMSAGPGNIVVDVYNLPQLVNTLFGTRWDRLMVEGSKESFVWADLDAMVVWLRDVVGDPEFADAVATTVADGEGYKAQIDAMFPLFKERVAQYRAVLRSEDEAQDEDGA